MPVVDVNGTPINVEVEGNANAPALVFSNSLGTNLHMWDDQAKALSQHFRVIRYDQRGHGRSGVPPLPCSIERLGRDVLAILDALEVPRAHFCGLSMGGMTGMWLGRFAAGRIDKLILANTAPKSQTPENWNTRIQIVNSKGMPGIVDTVLGIWFTKEFHSGNPRAIARMREMLLATDPQGYVSCCAAIRDMDQRWGIADIRLPTLIIAGRQDNATTLKDAEFMAARIPGAKLHMLDAAHISNVEQASGFTAAVRDFLED